MKKFIGVLAIASALVACNNSGDNTTKTDSTIKDSTTMTNKDTTKMSTDTTHKMGTDTTHK